MAAGDINGDADGDLTGLDGANNRCSPLCSSRRTPLTYSMVRPVFRAIAVSLYPRCFKPSMSCKQIDRAVLPAGKVLHQAHHHAVLGVSLDDDGRDLVLAERLIGFQSALATD